MFSQYYSSLDPKTLQAMPGVLAVIHFTKDCHPPENPGIIPIGLTSLSSHDCEVIKYGDGIVERGVDNDCHWGRMGDLMYVATWISPSDCRFLEAATESAYDRIFAICQHAGFLHPIRIWNFIPHINSGDGDQEEYKKFCVGRQLAFDKLQLARHQYPAASALGHHSEGAVIYMLASQQACQHHENPLQQPAYKYPRQYGPSSPSFSRATSIHFQKRRYIFVSGTASIRGHDTKAVGDLAEQVSITLDNIRHIIESIEVDALQLPTLRVYLRNSCDYLKVRALFEEPLVDPRLSWLNSSSVNYLLADVCRKNLLVEIEALACVSQ